MANDSTASFAAGVVKRELEDDEEAEEEFDADTGLPIDEDSFGKTTSKDMKQSVTLKAKEVLLHKSLTGVGFEGHTTEDVIEEWAEGASVHGLDYALNPNYVFWKRLFWAIVSATGVGLFVWQVFLLVDQYREYNLVSSVSAEFPNKLEFPEVTICSASRYQEFFGFFIEPKSEEEAELISQPFDEFIVVTIWNRKNIPREELPKYWKPVYTAYGRCWQFSNPNANENFVESTGLTGGLDVGIWIDQNKFQLDEISEAAAALVFVEEKGTKITQQSRFDYASPGVFNVIGIESTEIKRVPDSPWTRCSGEAPAYTQATCRDNCFLDSLQAECGCTRIGSTNSSLTFCPSDNVCLENFVLTDEQLFDVCDCRFPPCREMIYSTKKSTLAFSTSLFNRAELQDGWEEHFVEAHINFQRLQITKVSEDKEITLTQLFAQIGGMLGLFVGISSITLVEIFVELLGARLLPRSWGDKRLFGIGGKE